MKAIFFDFDNTLGNREKYAYLTYKEIFSEHKFGLSGIYLENIIQKCLLYDQHGYIGCEYVRQALKNRDGIDLGDHFAEEWKNRIWHYAELAPHVTDVLLELKRRGYFLGIITNGGVFEQRKKIEMTKLDKIVDFILISDEIGIKKPDPRIFQIAAKRNNFSPEECAYVGDQFPVDIFGAMQAGFKPIWYWPGNRLCGVKEICCINDLRNLVNIL